MIIVHNHVLNKPCNVYKGPMTRARAHRLQHKVNSLLIDYEHTSTRNDLLPNRGATHVLRFYKILHGWIGHSVHRKQVEDECCCLDFDFQIHGEFGTNLTPSFNQTHILHPSPHIFLTGLTSRPA